MSSTLPPTTIKERFKKARQGYLLRLLPLIPFGCISLAWFALLQAPTSPGESNLLFQSVDNVFFLSIGLLLLWLPIAIAWELRTWRCPACQHGLGGNANIKFCPYCGVELQ